MSWGVLLSHIGGNGGAQRTRKDCALSRSRVLIAKESVARARASEEVQIAITIRVKQLIRIAVNGQHARVVFPYESGQAAGRPVVEKQLGTANCWLGLQCDDIVVAIAIHITHFQMHWHIESTVGSGVCLSYVRQPKARVRKHPIAIIGEDFPARPEPSRHTQ